MIKLAKLVHVFPPKLVFLPVETPRLRCHVACAGAVSKLRRSEWRRSPGSFACRDPGANRHHQSCHTSQVTSRKPLLEVREGVFSKVLTIQAGISACGCHFHPFSFFSSITLEETKASFETWRFETVRPSSFLKKSQTSSFLVSGKKPSTCDTSQLQLLNCRECWLMAIGLLLLRWFSMNSCYHFLAAAEVGHHPSTSGNSVGMPITHNQKEHIRQKTH